MQTKSQLTYRDGLLTECSKRNLRAFLEQSRGAYKVLSCFPRILDSPLLLQDSGQAGVSIELRGCLHAAYEGHSLKN